MHTGPGALQRGTLTAALALLVVNGLRAYAAPPASSIGTAWAPVFVDEFDGAALDAERWRESSGCTPFCTSAGLASVEDGALLLANRAARPGDAATGDWIGADVVSRDAFGAGYCEVVVQAPSATGLATAAFLAPTDAVAPERWEMYLGEVFPPAGAAPGTWVVRQRAFDWTAPTATAQAPWIGGIAPAPSAATNYAAEPVTLGLYRTAAGDLGWYRNDTLTANASLPWDVGARTELVLHLRTVAAAFAGDASASAGAHARIHAVHCYRPADVLAMYEPFAYAPGSIDAQAGGTGFAGPWSVTPPTGGVATGDGVSLSYPAQSPAVGAGGTLLLTNATAQRTLALNIKLSELNAYFFSALVRKPDNASIRFELVDASGNIRWRTGLDDQERALAGIVSDATGPVSVPVVDQPVSVVSMMAARPGSGEEELRTIVFGESSAIPTRAFDIPAFDATQKQLSQVTLTTLRITAAGGPVAVDELRFGSTLASVTTLRADQGACPGPPDYIDDDVLDLRDAAAFLAHFDAQSPAADVNGDGRVDLRDYAEFTRAVSAGCP
ncbi:MAG TPA: GC-type dockerin domain-anchored protein [Phycisphaerae bacterium]|nr:GC-type dockerin domain-anchored protein [Phycisphaerae bacterium]